MTGADKVSGRELASILSLTEGRVRQLVSEGVLTWEKGPRGRVYELRRAIAEYVTYKIEDTVPTPELSELQRQRARKLRAESARSEFNLEVLKGKYLPVSAVERTTTEQSLVIKSRIFGLGPRLCHQLAGQSPDSIRETLDEEAESICRLLVQDFTSQLDEADKLIAEHQGKNGHDA